MSKWLDFNIRKFKQGDGRTGIAADITPTLTKRLYDDGECTIMARTQQKDSVTTNG